MSGYIKLFRGWRDTDGLTPSKHFSDAEAWLWLLENATWKNTTRWNAKGEEIRLQAGQIHVSLRALASAWGWHESAVRRFLNRLEKVKKATQLKAQSGTVLTIENWAKYQICDTALDTDTDTAATQPRHTQEEGKERKEKKKPIPFDLPEWVPVDAWDAFVDMRRSIKKPLSDRAKALSIKKLDELRKAGSDPRLVLENSVMNSWQGLFDAKPPKRQIQVGI